MKIISLKVRGIGVFSGEVELPIAALGDAELVAVVGANGAGKSTMLECIPGAMFRTTPSRGNLAGLANSRDSFVELGIETDQRYTLRLLVDGVARGHPCEAYLFDAAGAPLVSGKVRDFAAEVERRFVAPEVFMASAFSAQTRDGDFLSLPSVARKALFAKLLGLARLEQLAEAAGEHARAVETTLAGLRARADTLAAQAVTVLDVRQKLDVAQADRDAARSRVVDLEAQVAASRAAIDAWREESAALDRSLADARAALQRARDARQNSANALAESQRRLATAGARRAALEEKLSARASLQTKADAVSVLRSEAEAVDSELASLRAKVEAETASVAKWGNAAGVLRAKLEAAERSAKTTHEQRVRDAKVAADNLARAEQTAKRLDGVPCAGVGEYAACALIATAAEARAALPSLRSLDEQAREAAAFGVDTTDADDLRRELAALGPEPKSSSNTRLALSAREQHARNLRNDIAEAGKAEAQIAALVEVERQAVEADAEAETLRAEVDAARVKLVGDESAERVAAKLATDAVLAKDQHAATKPSVVDETAITAARRAEMDTAAVVARLEQALAQAEAAAGDLETVRAETEKTTADLDDWRHLATALGRSGVQALEIDAAGPEVSDLTNELLHACYGPRFSVSLETTQLKADGKGTKEVFDLRVIDTERGTEGSADQLSGGEKVLVSEALALAIAIYNGRRSARPMLTLFRDECSGALSSGNAIRYIEMLRRALRLGSFHRLFFVAHQENLWALADQRILFDNGTCRLADAADIVVTESTEAEAA